MTNDETLVAQAETFTTGQVWTPWREAGPILERARWLTREAAEATNLYRQLISCAVIRTPDGRVATFRRTTSEDPTMSGRTSVVIGGHVEDADRHADPDIQAILRAAALREMAEELEEAPAFLGPPIAIVTDSGTPKSRRHAAVIHEARTGRRTRSQVRDEFDIAGETNGAAETLSALRQRTLELDPWTRTIVSNIK